MLRLLAAVPLIALAGTGGCGSPTSASAPEATPPASGEPFRIAAGEAVAVDGYALRFVDLVEDSRCPEGATCVWEGRAKARFALSAPEAETDSRVLTLPYPGATDDESASWERDGVTVTFLDLLPPPQQQPDGSVREAEVRVEIAD